MNRRNCATALVLAASVFATQPLIAQRGGGGRGVGRGGQDPFPTTIPPDDQRIAQLKTDAQHLVDSLSTLTQQMIDMVYSFGELGFQEVETSKYLTGILEQNGFTVSRGVAGIPTAWVARWGSGKPVIALGSDIDGIPQASQKPGVAYHDPIVPGAPGHGEGHNSGVPLNITAAIAVKQLMIRDGIPGTIMLWPGVAEEQMAAKAYMLRAGLFKDVDAVLFAHVSSNMGVSWGESGQSALISAAFDFQGKAAHAAGNPWNGRSALDAAELMDIAWNFRREHLPLSQRSHSVIMDGGDQPNVVPSTATTWYYFRETNTPKVKALFALGDTIAQAAAMMTGTTLANVRILGSGWSGHFNKPIAETMGENMKKVPPPVWSDKDQQLARALQCEIGVRQSGLSRSTGRVSGTLNPPTSGGGSDDIGDISWNVPTVTLRYPANIPGLPGHNWTNGIAMATPIAHKGTTAGAKVQALTMIDLYLKPTILEQAWRYFNEIETRDTKYEPLMKPTDMPATFLNKAILDKYRPEMSKYYYDPTKYKTYLDQLGITYPTVHPCADSGGAPRAGGR
jgi:aminobenzoyl-glutamate utilization protein B